MKKVFFVTIIIFVLVVIIIGAVFVSVLLFGHKNKINQNLSEWKWKKVDSEVFSTDIPSNWNAELLWIKDNRFFYEIRSNNFKEISIISSDPKSSGIYVISGARIQILGSWENFTITQELLEEKLKKELSSLKDVNIKPMFSDGKCLYSNWNFGVGSSEETGTISAYYTSLEKDNDLIKISMKYSASYLSSEDAVSILARVLESIKYK